MRPRIPFSRRTTSADWPVELALALGAAALNVAGAVVPDPTVAYEYDDGGARLVVLAAVGGLVLWWRRTLPLTTFLVSTFALAAVSALEWRIGWMPVSWLFAVYALGAYASMRRGLVGIGIGLAVGGLLVARQAPYFDSWLAVGTLGQMVLIWLLGCAVQARRTTASAARDLVMEAARVAGTVAEEAARGERLRVARELHDSVTNALSAVTMQAAAIRREFPGRLDGPLTAIEETGRSALADLRRMLGALRGPSNDTAATNGTAGAAATDGLAAFDGLDAAVARVTGWRQPSPTPMRPGPLLSRDWPVDVAFGLAVAALNVTGSVVPDESVTFAYDDPVFPLLVLLAAAPGVALIWRRRFALVSLAVTLAALTAVAGLGWQTGNLPGTVLIASYAVGAWTPVRYGIAAAAGTIAAIVALGQVGRYEFDEPFAPGTFLLFAAPWLIGVLIRRRRLAAENAVREAEAAERDLAARRARAVADERLRVARDLHDLVAHGLAAVVVQTAAARQRADTPEVARRLAAVEEEARAALDDLRAMLDVLRGEDAAAGSPAPGLDELTELVSAHRRSHGPVRLEVDPAVAGESDSLRLVAYRIVQEALTNVGRHAPGAAATVVIRRTGSSVEVVVEDDGRAPVPAGARPSDGGFGLAGMRERVSLFGGSLEAGATPAGGFRVRAQLERTARG